MKQRVENLKNKIIIQILQNKLTEMRRNVRYWKIQLMIASRKLKKQKRNAQNYSRKIVGIWLNY